MSVINGMAEQARDVHGGADAVGERAASLGERAPPPLQD